MNHISFFSPVSYRDTPRTIKGLVLGTVDRYFNLGCKLGCKKKLEVIPGYTRGNEEGVHFVDNTSSLLGTVLKIVSYCTIVIPLIMFIAKIVLRSTNRFYLVQKQPDLISDTNLKISKLSEASSLQKNSESKEKNFLNYVAEKQKINAEIQSIWNLYLKKAHTKNILGTDIVEKAKVFIDDPLNFKNLKSKKIKVISDSIMKVYIPKELPFVLKTLDTHFFQNYLNVNEEMNEPNDLELQNRLEQRKKAIAQKYLKGFEQVIEAREICDRNNYKHLIFRSTDVYNGFIIENKPSSKNNKREMMRFYIENPKLFTEPVKEFIGFLCLARFDLSKNSIITPLGLNNNITMYYEEDQIKIGLIDLERLYSSTQKGGSLYLECQKAIQLFPLHMDDILEVAKKFDPHIEKMRSKLELEQNHALILFNSKKNGDHLVFLKKKGITFENLSEIVLINSYIKNKIQKEIISIISKKYERDEKFLDKNFDEVIALFEKSFHEILDLTTAFLSEIMKSQHLSTKKVMSYDQLASYRKLHFHNSHPLYKKLNEQIGLKLMGCKITDEKMESFLSLIINSIFTEMANTGVIAFYDAKHGIDGDVICSLHC